MNKIFRLFFYFLILCIAAFFPRSLLAQSAPEFHLDIQFADTSQHGTPIVFPYVRSIGYDPSARDGYDSQFNEDDTYAGSLLEPGNDLFFFYPASDSATRIDIRHKPSSSAFSIDYYMAVSYDWYPTGRLFWNPKSIPSAINAIWIRPLNRLDTVLRDMTQDTSFAVTAQQNSDWNGEYLITLFYNTPPPSLSRTPNAGTSKLIVNARAFPNPSIAKSDLAIELTESAMVTLTGYDVTGRRCLSTVRLMPPGSSDIDLSRLGDIHGAVMLHVEASSGGKDDDREIFLMRE